MRNVAIIGSGQSAFQKSRTDVTYPELVREGATMALDDAGITMADVKAVVVPLAPDALIGIGNGERWCVEALGAESIFAVSDQGRGISPDDLQHLFERYWRSQDVVYKGTGLGLAIARGIVAAHGGRIWAESELGRGATFRFSVPNVEKAPSSEVPDIRPR